MSFSHVDRDLQNDVDFAEAVIQDSHRQLATAVKVLYAHLNKNRRKRSKEEVLAAHGTHADKVTGAFDEILAAANKIGDMIGEEPVNEDGTVGEQEPESTEETEMRELPGSQVNLNTPDEELAKATKATTSVTSVNAERPKPDGTSTPGENVTSVPGPNLDQA